MAQMGKAKHVESTNTGTSITVPSGRPSPQRKHRARVLRQQQRQKVVTQPTAPRMKTKRLTTPSSSSMAGSSLLEELTARQGPTVYAAAPQRTYSASSKRRARPSTGQGHNVQKRQAGETNEVARPRSKKQKQRKNSPTGSASGDSEAYRPPSARKKKKKKRQSRQGDSAEIPVDLVSSSEDESPAEVPAPMEVEPPAAPSVAPAVAQLARSPSVAAAGDMSRFDASVVLFRASKTEVHFSSRDDWRFYFKRDALHLEMRSEAGSQFKVKMNDIMCRFPARSSSSSSSSSAAASASARTCIEISGPGKKLKERLASGLKEKTVGADDAQNCVLRIYPRADCGSSTWAAGVRAAAEQCGWGAKLRGFYPDATADAAWADALLLAEDGRKAQRIREEDAAAQKRGAAAQLSSDAAAAQAMQCADFEAQRERREQKATMETDAKLARALQSDLSRSRTRSGGSGSSFTSSAHPPREGTRRSSRRRRTRQSKLGEFASSPNSKGHDEEDPTKVLEYPFDPKTGAVARDSVTITRGDCNRLKKGHFLNDNIIDFRLRTIQELSTVAAALGPAAAGAAAPEPPPFTVKVFSSFFYKQLSSSNGSSNSRYDSVKKWTKGDDIFRHDFLLIPVCESLHWSLVMICHPRLAVQRTINNLHAKEKERSGGDFEGDGEAEENADEDDAEEEEEEEEDLQPSILHFDSLSCHPTTTVAKNLRGYLKREWEDKHSEQAELDGISLKTMPHMRVKVPSQSNGCDCGVFVLKYAEEVLKLLREDASVAAASKQGREKKRAKTTASGTGLPTIEAFSSSAEANCIDIVSSEDPIEDAASGSEDESSSSYSEDYGPQPAEKVSEQRAQPKSKLHVTRPENHATMRKQELIKHVRKELKKHIHPLWFATRDISRLRIQIERQVETLADKQRLARATTKSEATATATAAATAAAASLYGDEC